MPDTQPYKFSFYRNAGSLRGGGRFWQTMCDEWAKSPDYDPAEFTVAYLNISAPLRVFVRLWFGRKKIVVRVDGVYHEKISRQAVRSIPNGLLRAGLGMLYAVCGEREFLSELFNLFPRNFGILIKVFLSSGVIFQSPFSRRLYSRYISQRKASWVIVNGFRWSLTAAEFQLRAALVLNSQDPIQLITTYDFWRPSKRLEDLVRFVIWCNQQGRIRVRLTILGYRGDQHPANLTLESRSAIARGDHFAVVAPFNQIDETIRQEFLSQHFYATFTYRDNCPNAVIEAMSFGLPVLGVNSGGLPDIVKDAGILVASQDADEVHFSSFDHSFDYPAVDFVKVEAALIAMVKNYPDYCERTRERFLAELDDKAIARRYLNVRKDLG